MGGFAKTCQPLCFVALFLLYGKERGTLRALVILSTTHLPTLCAGGLQCGCQIMLQLTQGGLCCCPAGLELGLHLQWYMGIR